MATNEEAEKYIQALDEEAESLAASLGQMRQALERGLPLAGVDYPAALYAVNMAIYRMEHQKGDDNEAFHLIPFSMHGQLVARCPCCQKIPQLWERSGRTTLKAVSCTQGDAWGGLENGCPLYSPPQDFYKATCREAAWAWNVWATQCTAEAGLPTPTFHPTKENP